MKKFTLSLGVFSLLLLASCKKDYDCHCEADDGVKMDEKKIEKAKEDDAKQECETYEATLNGGDHDHDGDGQLDHHYHCHLD